MYATRRRFSCRAAVGRGAHCCNSRNSHHPGGLLWRRRSPHHLAASSNSAGVGSSLQCSDLLQRCLGSSSSKASKRGRPSARVRRSTAQSQALGAPANPPPSPAATPGLPKVVSSTSSLRNNVLPTGWFRSILQARIGGGAGTSSNNYDRARMRFTADRLWAAAGRLPLWVALTYVALGCDETSPFAIITVRGPSMLPTLASDQTDLWLVVRYPRLGRSEPLMAPHLVVGDVVGIQVPFRPPQGRDEEAVDNIRGTTVVSCKRVVGVEGDVVKRYGEFAPLLAAQDPAGLGIAWPDFAEHDDNDDHHRDLDPSCPWDADGDNNQPRKDPHRTLVVPPGHVWVEGDCPGCAVDSRHYGPVPMEAVRGKVVARLWPPWDVPDMNYRHFRRRPHPISLDDGTLRLYNVHRLKLPVPGAAGLGEK